MTTPDWQLPPGVDRGLWDYLRSGEMVRGYDAQLAAAPLARADVAFCESVFPTPGRLADLGCGTGRLGVHFAARGFDCVGVDLSDEMLAAARANAAAAGAAAAFVSANLVDLAGLADGAFDYAACLFSTLGMVRGAAHRAAAVRSAARVLRPGGRLVLHVHNRWYHRLGRRRVLGQAVRTAWGAEDAGDVTMPQAYGGAPLTLHHFTRREATAMLTAAGFRVTAVRAVTDSGDRASGPGRTVRAYGYLFAAEKPPAPNLHPSTPGLTTGRDADMADTSVTKVEAKHAPTGPHGEKYLASSPHVGMRLWDEKPDAAAKPPARRPYETVGYVIRGAAELHTQGQVVKLAAGDSYVVPKGAEHTYKILEPFTAVEATHPPAHVHGRDAGG